MRLIVGLGNPEKKYDRTRHNTGFFVIDKLLKKLNVEVDEEMFKGFYTTIRHKNEKIIILKPQTYMNLSGECISKLSKYFKIPTENIIVCYDDMDLSVGKIRLRTSGSSAGQKGMGNIIDLLGTQDIKRIRVGISNDSKIDTVDYVLGKFSKEEFKIYDQACEKAADALMYYIEEKDFSKVMNKYNQQ